MHRRFVVCRRLISSSGICACVCSSVLRGLVHVQLVGRAGFEPPLDDGQRLALEGDVLLGVLDALFEGAHLSVVGRHVAEQRDQNVVVVLDRGVEGGDVRFDRPAESAPEVEFPGQVEPVVPLAGEPVAGQKLGICGLPACLAARERTRRRLRLGEQVAAGDRQLRPRFQHAEPGLAERQVLLVRGPDQAVERRVVEDRPPPAQVVRRLPHAHVGGIDPVVRDRRRRAAVVGAHFEPVVNVFAEGSTAARHRGREGKARRAGEPPRPWRPTGEKSTTAGGALCRRVSHREITRGAFPHRTIWKSGQAGVLPKPAGRPPTRRAAGAVSSIHSTISTQPIHRIQPERLETCTLPRRRGFQTTDDLAVSDSPRGRAREVPGIRPAQSNRILLLGRKGAADRRGRDAEYLNGPA